MAEAPSVRELREKYREVMENEAVTSISNWTLHNNDEPTDESKYVANAEKLATSFFPIVEKALEKIK